MKLTLLLVIVVHLLAEKELRKALKGILRVLMQEKELVVNQGSFKKRQRLSNPSLVHADTGVLLNKDATLKEREQAITKDTFNTR